MQLYQLGGMVLVYLEGEALRTDIRCLAYFFSFSFPFPLFLLPDYSAHINIYNELEIPVSGK